MTTLRELEWKVCLGVLSAALFAGGAIVAATGSGECSSLVVALCLAAAAGWEIRDTQSDWRKYRTETKGT